ncbi:unnamed protein product [Caenorhabditis sp. 36 PRJEB53466]|nr:unnamed protein product [Caenorhabditis sp. 36 PRJEB53466]
MRSPFLLTLVLLLSPALSVSQDCSGFFSIENACNSLILEVAQEWPRYKPIPSPKVASSLSLTCMKALNCIKSLECPEKNTMISVKLADVAELCSGLWAFAGSFGQCLQIIRSQDTSNEYPCLKYWDNEEQSPTCQFFTSDYDCAEMLVENQCGADALASMRRNKNFIEQHFECAEKSDTTRQFAFLSQ